MGHSMMRSNAAAGKSGHLSLHTRAGLTPLALALALSSMGAQ